MKPKPDYFKAQPFRCPSCKRYINFKRDECRYCLARITPEIRDSMVRAERSEAKAAAVQGHRLYLAIGIGLTVAGLLNGFLLELDAYYGGWLPCLSALAILLGGVFAFMGIKGLVRERKG